MLNCPQCRASTAATAKFCANCGTALAGAIPPTSTSRGSATVMSLVVAGLCLLYLFNPTAGFFELIPDNFPLIGNLDEAMATAGLLWALRNLGMRLPGL